jgi:hypothetical protein
VNPESKISIVVTIVDGGPYLRAFLESLTRQTDAPPIEIIVPYDASIAEVGTLAPDFPDARFLDLGTLSPERPIASQAGQHELYDRRRSAGLAAATGDIIAILEDRGHPVADWAKTAARLHRDLGKAVIGGAIDCKEPVSLLNWAIWVCDFNRYGRPFDSGPRDWVSDVNITYSRKALEATRHLWKDRFHEPLVHWHLMEQGEELWLSNELVVEHARPPHPLGRVLAERFAWGRLFGYIRARQMTLGKRILLSLAGPAVPPVLWLRHGRMRARKGRLGRYFRALPHVMLLTTAWTAGEVWGAFTGRP